MERYDCSFDFDNETLVRGCRYVVVYHGDLDLTNAMMLRTFADVKKYIKECAELHRGPQTVFAVKLMGIYHF